MSEPIFCPAIIRAIVWAEKTTVFDPGTEHEVLSTKRSHETFCISGSTPEELMQAFLACRQINSPEQLFLKGSKIKTTKS